MLGFLRRLRRSLIDEGHLSKYLFYAAGEILLVMVGILLALQINNWNQSRKDTIEFQHLVSNLKQEFESNALSLAEIKEEVEATLDANRFLFSIIGDTESVYSESVVDSLIEITYYWSTWLPSNSVPEELTNSGKLSSLSNDKLKGLLIKWKRQVEDINRWNRRMEQGSQGMIDYVKTKGSLRNTNAYRIGVDRSKLGANNIDLIKDLGFENQLNEKIIFTQFLIANYEEVDVIIKEIIKEADNYLKSVSN